MLDWVHGATEIPEGGRRFERTATAAERVAVAAELDVLGCRKLTADYKVRPMPGGRYRVEGRVAAEVDQACVVTLEPVTQAIDETFDVTFWPKQQMPEGPTSEREILSEPEIEPMSDGRIEAGRIVFETLAAALDPYPRRPEAEFDWKDPKDAGDASPSSPFAVLKTLKDKS